MRTLPKSHLLLFFSTRHAFDDRERKTLFTLRDIRLHCPRETDMYIIFKCKTKCRMDLNYWKKKSYEYMSGDSNYHANINSISRYKSFEKVALCVAWAQTRHLRRRYDTLRVACV